MSGRPIKRTLRGPSGTGKTTIPDQSGRTSPSPAVGKSSVGASRIRAWRMRWDCPKTC